VLGFIDKLTDMSSESLMNPLSVTTGLSKTKCEGNIKVFNFFQIFGVRMGFNQSLSESWDDGEVKIVGHEENKIIISSDSALRR